MADPRIRIHPSPAVKVTAGEADAIGVSPSLLIEADLARFRALAQAAVPDLTEWQWGLISHILGGIELHRLLSGDDTIPAASWIAAEVDVWADGALDDEALAAGELRRKVIGWSPLAIAGLMMGLRRAT